MTDDWRMIQKWCDHELLISAEVTPTSPSIALATRKTLMIDPATTNEMWVMCDGRCEWCDWCHLTELLLDWAATWLKCYLTELLLSWSVTELLLDWTVTWLKCDFTDLLALRKSEVSRLKFIWLKQSKSKSRTCWGCLNVVWKHFVCFLGREKPKNLGCTIKLPVFLRGLWRSGAAPMGRGLLGHALLHRKARLAVVASAFSDVGYLQCRETWKKNWDSDI